VGGGQGSDTLLLQPPAVSSLDFVDRFHQLRQSVGGSQAGVFACLPVLEPHVSGWGEGWAAPQGGGGGGEHLTCLPAGAGPTHESCLPCPTLPSPHPAVMQLEASYQSDPAAREAAQLRAFQASRPSAGGRGDRSARCLPCCIALASRGGVIVCFGF
jgi:hypothetical protein